MNTGHWTLENKHLTVRYDFPSFSKSCNHTNFTKCLISGAQFWLMNVKQEKSAQFHVLIIIWQGFFMAYLCMYLCKYYNLKILSAQKNSVLESLEFPLCIFYPIDYRGFVLRSALSDLIIPNSKLPLWPKSR